MDSSHINLKEQLEVINSSREQATHWVDVIERGRSFICNRIKKDDVSLRQNTEE
jgi:hypothetical protein